ncbi:MAG: heme exporter protein CcmD [Pseudomarimonas sp.]
MSDFFAMGGHGVYIWSSYAVFLLALIGDALAPRLRLRRVRRELAQRLRRQAAKSAA